MTGFSIVFMELLRVKVNLVDSSKFELPFFLIRNDCKSIIGIKRLQFTNEINNALVNAEFNFIFFSCGSDIYTTISNAKCTYSRYIPAGYF